MLSKFVGETEKNVRDLFADAEQDQRTRGKRTTLEKFTSILSYFYCYHFFFSGDQSDLHVIIFDEIDAICKVRAQFFSFKFLIPS